MKSIILLALTVLPFIFSCQREKGCTELDALNYNPDAEKNDGTCEFMLVSFSRIYFDSTHHLVKDTAFDHAEHKITLKFSSERYAGPDVVEFVYSNSQLLNEWVYLPTEDIIITNELWQFDLFLDSEAHHLSTFSRNVFQLLATSTNPYVIGTYFEDEGLSFELSVAR